LLCSSASASENQKTLETLRQHIKSIRNELAAQEEIKKTATDALQETEQSISVIRRKQAELKSEQQKLDQELQRLTSEYRQTKNELTAQQDQLNVLFYQQYTRNQHNDLLALFNLKDSSQSMRDRYYLQQLALARSDHINAVQSSLGKLRTLAETIHQQKTAIDSIQEEFATQSKKLKLAKQKHIATLDQASREIRQQHNQIKLLEQDEKRIARLLTKISAALEREKNDGIIYNNRLPTSTDTSTNFKSLKGRLSLPVQGKLTNRFGHPRTGKLTWKGLFISTSVGSDVKAIAGGRIVFSDWLRGFGNLMIIEHNQGYMSLYGNNEVLLKRIGDTVNSGDTIALVGSSGGNPDPGLYFELRHNGKAFDPLTWIKIE